MIIERHNRTKSTEMFLDETIFTTQNRYMGVRGCFEEGLFINSNSVRGTYINGIYDTHDIHYEETGFGFPKYGESIVNITDAQGIYIKIGETILSPRDCKIIELRREYNLEKGYTIRNITYQTPEGYQFKLQYKRLTSLAFKELFMIDSKITSVNYDGPIKITSTLDGDVRNYSNNNDPRMSSSNKKRVDVLSIDIHKNYGVMTSKTNHSMFKILTLMTHDQSFLYKAKEDQIIAEKTFEIKCNESINFRKYALYFNSLDHQNLEKDAVKLYEKLSHIDVYESQASELKSFWNYASIDFEDTLHPNLNQVINYNLYQLYTSGGGNERINIPAKGLSGEGYEGHAFWDTEIYMIPFFMQVDPKITKSLLSNRYNQIEDARQEARLLGVEKGIKFAWRTISGKETSSYFLAGQAQYHINSDIAYAFIKYYQLHKDQNYFIQFGLPILIETARFFKEIVVNDENGFHIHNVTGPDEYTAMVNDNYYTNSMVKYQLDYLVSFIRKFPIKTKNIIKSYNITKSEINKYQDIANNLYLPYDKEIGIDAQDDSFLHKQKWDLSKINKSDYPLLIHYHPLKIYRHQVLKQPDTVLSHYLLNNRPQKVMKRSYDYYETLTTHDSSLSKCIHAVQAARLGDTEKAYHYFLDTIRMDLDNIQKNTEYGLHVANLGGMFMTILYGFVGLQIDDDIRINPQLPKNINHLNMHVRIHETCIMNIKLTHGEINITVNEPIALYVYDEFINIEKHYTKKIK